jgi:hypothetical protein
MTFPARECVEDHEFQSAAEFLDALSPRHRFWADAPPSWIYRGQGNADWTLKSKAVRDPSLFAKHGIKRASSHPGYVPPAVVGWHERSGLQEQMLLRFRDLLDKSGLVIPVPSPNVTFHESQVTISSMEPSRAAFPLLALAQHHGLPTILLDWTRRALVAAYFAAVVAAHPKDRGIASHLAVWALQRGDLKEPSEGPSFYDAPGGTNPNLNAQAGLFMWFPFEDEPSLEEHLARLNKITGSTPPLRRLMLPVDEAPRLLRLLSYEGVTGASMFPGADGVVKAMLESALWDSGS